MITVGYFLMKNSAKYGKIGKTIMIIGIVLFIKVLILLVLFGGGCVLFLKETKMLNRI